MKFWQLILYLRKIFQKLHALGTPKICVKINYATKKNKQQQNNMY